MRKHRPHQGAKHNRPLFIERSFFVLFFKLRPLPFFWGRSFFMPAKSAGKIRWQKGDGDVE